jgi:hypothetical protein
MKKIIVLSIVATLVVAAGSAWACSTCGCSTPKAKKVGAGVKVEPAAVKTSVTAAKAKPAAAAVCLKCGQVKGTDVCCKQGQLKCAKCGLAKGSPGCCKIPKGAKNVALCTSCGQFKGSSTCCKKGVETCKKCNLAKGSPGCCKLAVAK